MSDRQQGVTQIRLALANVSQLKQVAQEIEESVRAHPEAAEEFVGRVARFAGALLQLRLVLASGGADVDHGGSVLVDQSAEIGKRAGRGLGRRGLGQGAGTESKASILESQGRRGNARDHHEQEFRFGHCRPPVTILATQLGQRARL